MIWRHWLCFMLFAAPHASMVSAQVQQVGTIAGQLRTSNGDNPSHQMMVELQLHGAMVNSVYTDAQGRFSFGNLDPDSYHVIINDAAYDSVDELVSLRPESPITNLRIFLTPRKQAKPADGAQSQPSGENPFLVDPSTYNAHFSKKAVKEYQRGLEADRGGNRDDAIAHYQAALKLAEDYYPAHNNLGSEYLAKSDFPSARKEFEQVIRLNQSDATGYFNLANVCTLMGRLDDAQRYLNEGFRRDPNSALGHFLLGSLDMRQGKYDEAEAALRQAIQTGPTMAQARLQLVNLLLQRGRQVDAASELRAFVAAFPNSPFTPKARQLLQKLGRAPSSQSAPN